MFVYNLNSIQYMYVVLVHVYISFASRYEFASQGIN